ncbi:MAG TPA: response regulator [Candidatus Binatia bacterium]|nr:response regulator [Candidatus Binatia bacterium]
MQTEPKKMARPRSILVIDDEDNFLTLVRWYLSQRGFEIQTASSRDEALDVVQERSFDIALLDIKLGTADGLSLLDALIARSPKTKVVMMTAYPTMGTIKQAFEKGATRYLTKPLDLQELSDSLKTL